MATSSIPTHLGRYSIVEQIGVGASSNVYLAINNETYASVAIKQLRETIKKEGYRRLLANEVALAPKLNHKNIVRFIRADLSEPSGPYTVMEYINLSTVLLMN